MLDYDETLDVLEFSTGKPKTDHNLMKTVYLQTKNNVVSDLITVETKDLVNVDVRISYKVNFEGDSSKWFNVSDYIKLLSQHMRSLIRNAVKKENVENFYETATDIIRDIILGKATDKKSERKGRSFDENGMRIYDVEVLNLEIGDSKIASMIVNNQHQIIEQNLRSLQMRKNLEFVKKEAVLKREEIDENLKTFTKEQESATVQFESRKNQEESELAADVAKQDQLDEITTRKNVRLEKKQMVDVKISKEQSAVRIGEVKAQMASITPGLIEALVATNGVELTKILAENLTAQRDGSGLSNIFSGSVKGGLDGILEAVKGTPLESKIGGILKDYNDLNKSND